MRLVANVKKKKREEDGDDRVKRGEAHRYTGFNRLTRLSAKSP